MADNTTQQAHILEYTGEGLNSILRRADIAIIDGTTEKGVSKSYIKPFNGGLGPIDSNEIANHILLGGDDNKINTVAPTPGALYASIEGRAPTYGTLPVSYGGTGETTLSGLRKSLGLGSETTDALKVEYGGTGMTAPESNRIVATSGGAYSLISPLEAGKVLVSNGIDALPSFKDTSEVINSVGKVTSGSWEANTIGVSYGGTGVSSYDDLSKELGLGVAINDVIPVSRGGTGVSSYDNLSNALNLGNTTNTAIPVERGGTGQTSKENLITWLDLSLNNGVKLESYVIPEENGGTGYSKFQDAFNNNVKTINLNGITFEGTISVANGGTGVSDINDFRNTFEIYSKSEINSQLNEIDTEINSLSTEVESLKNTIAETFPTLQVKETVIDTIRNSKEYSTDEIQNFNRIIKTDNATLDIVIGLPTNVTNGTEVKIIKAGLGEVTINEQEVTNTVNNCICIDNVWYF